MPKHTEGPWNLENVGTGWTIGPREMAGRDYVADVHEHVPGPEAMPDEEAAANARLIAAAPELLEEHERARFSLGVLSAWARNNAPNDADLRGLLDEMIAGNAAAIAKAEGR